MYSLEHFITLPSYSALLSTSSEERSCGHLGCLPNGKGGLTSLTVSDHRLEKEPAVALEELVFSAQCLLKGVFAAHNPAPCSPST